MPDVSRVERDRLILHLRRRGLTLQQIATRVELTATRVRQVLSEMGGPSPDEVAKARRRYVAEAKEKLEAEIVHAAELNPTASADRLAQILSVSRSVVVDALGREEATRRKEAVSSLPSAAMYTRPIREVADLHDMPGLTVRQYDRLREARHPSSARIRQVVGSWSEACHLAGVEPIGQGRTRTPQWSQKDIETWVDDYLASESPSFTYRDFDAWLRKQDGAPSAQTVRNITSMNWSQILAAGNNRARGRTA